MKEDAPRPQSIFQAAGAASSGEETSKGSDGDRGPPGKKKKEKKKNRTREKHDDPRKEEGGKSWTAPSTPSINGSLSLARRYQVILPTQRTT